MWRIFIDGKAKDGFGRCAQRRRCGMVEGRLAKARGEVRRLQMRIAKAVKEGRWNKVHTLQRLLTRSFYAKLLAVKRVPRTRGRIPLELTVSCGRALEPNGGL